MPLLVVYFLFFKMLYMYFIFCLALSRSIVTRYKYTLTTYKTSSPPSSFAAASKLFKLSPIKSCSIIVVYNCFTIVSTYISLSLAPALFTGAGVLIRFSAIFEFTIYLFVFYTYKVIAQFLRYYNPKIMS
ncbi:hypothetical protein [Sulfolobus tengchongensis spindle-shaped virus 3]|nr:hypothetical protein [Sulfolobus tengchongensis spindle-shaped virus 3]